MIRSILQQTGLEHLTTSSTEIEMTQRSFFLITSILFLLIALLHAVRLLQGWQVTIGGAVVPVWVSWIGLAISGFLAYEGFLLWKMPMK